MIDSSPRKVDGVGRFASSLTFVVFAAAVAGWLMHASIGATRTSLLAGSIVALALSVLAAVFASRLFARTLRALVHQEVSGERKSNLGTLAQERRRLETILESLGEGVIALDDSRHITLVNETALRLLDLDESPVGQPLLAAVRLPALVELLDVAEDEDEDEPDEPLATELELPGTSRRLMARVTSLRAHQGLLVVIHDVTERRRLEAVRRDFVANVSHELRTPVSVIRANAETLLSGGIEDQRRAGGFVSAILRNAERLSTLVADLLDLSRLEAGRMPLSPRSLSAHAQVKRVTDSVGALAREKNVKLEVDVPEDLEIRADERAIDHILLNLVDNAVKYTPSTGHVVVRARQADGHVRFEVQDDGPGIDAHHRARIFERFYRVDPGRSKDMGGTGLGLSIVKHLAESMGGSVGIEPVRPHGSVFWVRLPAEDPAVRAA